MKIQVEHYTKRLKGVTVLEDVNVELCGGHIYGLRGKKWIWKNDVYACSERIDECKRRKGVG
ncbi:MAG: hypothetical protein ACLU8S_22075 [Coprococcus phoceensis]